VTTQTAKPPTTAGHPDEVIHHWIMTVETNDGRQGTNDGVIGAIPGEHTHQSTYSAVRQAMRQWIGTDDFTVVFYSLNRNDL
jgi:hypothetical protein